MRSSSSSSSSNCIEKRQKVNKLDDGEELPASLLSDAAAAAAAERGSAACECKELSRTCKTLCEASNRFEFELVRGGRAKKNVFPGRTQGTGSVLINCSFCLTCVKMNSLYFGADLPISLFFPQKMTDHHTALLGCCCCCHIIV